jgi:hypothetical protein
MEALGINNGWIYQKMINIEEELNILNYRLSIKFNNRLDRINNSDSQIKARMESLNNEWDRLEIESSK